MRDFDISREVENCGVPVIKTFNGIRVTDSLPVEVRPASRPTEPGDLRGPLLCGAELPIENK